MTDASNCSGAAASEPQGTPEIQVVSVATAPIIAEPPFDKSFSFINLSKAPIRLENCPLGQLNLHTNCTLLQTETFDPNTRLSGGTNVNFYAGFQLEPEGGGKPL